MSSFEGLAKKKPHFQNPKAKKHHLKEGGRFYQQSEFGYGSEVSKDLGIPQTKCGRAYYSKFRQGLLSTSHGKLSHGLCVCTCMYMCNMLYECMYVCMYVGM